MKKIHAVFASLLTGLITSTSISFAAGQLGTQDIRDSAITTAKINNSAVTLPKIANIAPESFLVNPSGASAAPSALSVNDTKELLELDNLSNVAQIPLSYLDTDTNLTANSDSKVATQKAVKAYVLANAGGGGSGDWGDIGGTLSDQTDLQSELNDLQDQIDAIDPVDLSEEWQSWTPSYRPWTGTGTLSTVTNSAKYKIIGSICFFRVSVKVDAAETANYGLYFLNYPVTPKYTDFVTMSGSIVSPSNAPIGIASHHLVNSSEAGQYVSTAAGTSVFVTNNTLNLSGFYEID